MHSNELENLMRDKEFVAEAVVEKKMIEDEKDTTRK